MLNKNAEIFMNCSFDMSEKVVCSLQGVDLNSDVPSKQTRLYKIYIYDTDVDLSVMSSLYTIFFTRYTVLK